MTRQFTLEYWLDEGWYVGKLKEVPGGFSQGESLQDLEENIRDAYGLIMAENESKLPAGAQTKQLESSLDLTNNRTQHAIQHRR